MYTANIKSSNFKFQIISKNFKFTPPTRVTISSSRILVRKSSRAEVTSSDDQVSGAVLIHSVLRTPPDCLVFHKCNVRYLHIHLTYLSKRLYHTTRFKFLMVNTRKKYRY